jgi:hypothetical protein
VEGVTFRPAVRQSAITVIATALPMAGGVYAVARSAWYPGGIVWTVAAGLLLLAGLSTLADETRLDADGISVRRFLIYRFFVPWALVDTVREVKPPLHRRGRAVAVSTLIGQAIVLPAPRHLPVLPDPRFPARMQTLLGFVRSATSENRRALPRPTCDIHVVTRRNLESRVTITMPPAVRAIAARGIPQAILALATLALATGSLISLAHSTSNAAGFNAPPPCAATPPSDSDRGWCADGPMTVGGMLPDPDAYDAPYGFDVEQAPNSLPIFVRLTPDAPVLNLVTVNDLVYDVVVKGDTAGALTYDGQRIQTADSPLLAVTAAEEQSCFATGLAACSLLLFLRARRPHSAAVRAGLASFGTFTFVSLVIAGSPLYNPGIALLPFFALTVGCARLLWTGYPFAAPCPADQTSGVLWKRDDLVGSGAARR